MYTDKKMLELLEILKAENRIRFNTEFCDAAEMSKQHLSHIKNGTAHFTADHIRNVCTVLMVNANWIMGTELQIFRNQSNVNRKVNPTKLNRPSDNVLN